MTKLTPWNSGPRPVPGKEPPALKDGQERRWLKARTQETRGQALARARETMPWGAAAVGEPTLGLGQWVFTITARAA